MTATLKQLPFMFWELDVRGSFPWNSSEIKRHDTLLLYGVIYGPFSLIFYSCYP